MDIKKHIPNTLTFMRLACAPVFPFASQEVRWALFGIAVVTEYLDGFLSRRWSEESDTGRLFDPIADKIFVMAMLGTFLWEDWLTWTVLLLVGTRDIVVFLGCTWIWTFGDREEFDRMKPRYTGKAATAFQLAFLLALLGWQESPIWLTAATVLMSMLAAADYVRFYFKDVRGVETTTE